MSVVWVCGYVNVQVWGMSVDMGTYECGYGMCLFNSVLKMTS